MFILLAEDDANISTIAKMALEQLGNHVVQIAHDGEMALQMALNETFDLILLDEMIPYMRQCPNPSPIIFLSAKSQVADIDEFEKAGLGFIAKPFDPIHLNSQISEILSSKESA